MRNHYIPRSYLKGFTEAEGSPYIFMYEKRAKKSIRTNILNVAQETGFYSDEIEKFLADKIETPGKPVLLAIRNHESIGAEARQILVNYMIVMMIRVPHSKEDRIKWLQQNIDPYLNDLEKHLSELYESRPDKRTILGGRIQELATLRAERKPIPEKMWYTSMSPEHYPQVSWAMKNMTWQFLTTKEDAFLTCDNPLFFFRELGLGRTNSELYFPISTRVALWGTWRSKSLEGYKKATDSFIHEANRRIVSVASRYIYFSKGRDDLVRFVNRTNHRVKYLITRQAG